MKDTGVFHLKEEHHKIMIEAGCDIKRLITFRKDIHKNAEIAFGEIRTQ